MSHENPPRRHLLDWIPIRVDEYGRLAEDLACGTCHYNLKGVPVVETCPECGTPIEETLQDHKSAWAAWQKWLSRRLILSVMSLCLFLATVSVTAYLQTVHNDNPPLAALAALVLYGIGLYLGVSVLMTAVRMRRKWWIIGSTLNLLGYGVLSMGLTVLFTVV